MARQQRLRIYGPDLRREHVFHVHDAECEENNRREYVYSDAPMVGLFWSRTEVCDFVYPPTGSREENGTSLPAFKFFPCVKIG